MRVAPLCVQVAVFLTSAVLPASAESAPVKLALGLVLSILLFTDQASLKMRSESRIGGVLYFLYLSLPLIPFIIMEL